MKVRCCLRALRQARVCARVAMECRKFSSCQRVYARTQYNSEFEVLLPKNLLNTFQTRAYMKHSSQNGQYKIKIWLLEEFNHFFRPCHLGWLVEHSSAVFDKNKGKVGRQQHQQGMLLRMRLQNSLGRRAAVAEEALTGVQ